jgi:hypothetical protein
MYEFNIEKSDTDTDTLFEYNQDANSNLKLSGVYTSLEINLGNSIASSCNKNAVGELST